MIFCYNKLRYPYYRKAKMYIFAFMWPRLEINLLPAVPEKRPPYRVIRGKHAIKPGTGRTNRPQRRHGGAH